MESRARRVSELVKRYDRRLFATWNMRHKVVTILRQADRLEASDFYQHEPSLASLNPQLILALTDNWTLSGQPVDWGLEPILDKLKSIDGWRDFDHFTKMVKRRVREELEKERVIRNELRARAADLRPDFAKATNDINTSTLEKVDYRRLKDGNC